ncbi:zona pellucida sperm-binding protein 3 [Etheostoma spectabile]|uniref:zona pellucida sperm-binding protein 3 n=1 Tax=Etheostoma spectabile TaxID=54343 RepID=UPI0013AF448C|nr:zona pellucida sperm-binding protein 3-like [Etheostoma spectabile]
MGSRQFIVFGFVLACVGLSDARFLSMSEPTYWEVEVEVSPEAEPEREHSRKSSQRSRIFHAKHILPALKPHSWKFPEDPVDLVKKHPVKFELRQPVTTNRVAVRCWQSKIQVEVSQDLLGLGKLIKPEDLTLGDCSATEVDTLSHVLVFESELHTCGSRLVITENVFIYAFTLVYKPKVFGGIPIIRSQSAVIGVECHYPNKIIN